MSGKRRRSESLWDRKEDIDPQNETEEFQSSFLGGGSPKRSNSEANVFMSGDVSRQPSRDPIQGNENMSMDNENSDRHGMKANLGFDEWDNQYASRPSDNSYGQPYRGGERTVGGRDRDRSRSRSPHRSRDRDRDRDRGNIRDQGRARSPSRGGANRLDNDSTERWSDRPEHSGGSRFRNDRNSADHSRSKGSDGYRKDAARNEEGRDYQRSNRSGYDDQDYRRQSNRSVRDPCRFFIMGQCNRTSCKFSHDLPKSGGYEERSLDNTEAHNSGSNDDKNRQWDGPLWSDVESGGFDKMSRDKRDPPGWNESDKNTTILPQPASVTYNMDMHSNQESQLPDAHNMASQYPSNYNGNENGSVHGVFSQLNKGEKALDTSENNIPQVTSETIASTEQNLKLGNSLGMMYNLPISASSGAPADSTLVNEPVKTGLPRESQISVEPSRNLELSENKIADNAEIPEAVGKVDEGNAGNDEKAMRQFRIALVEFVKEVLKPTWKEGKMSKDAYKTIVKKVVEKVTTTIQGVQIPRTQEKIDQYLAFSKSKITKLVEAYVGRLQKA